MATSTMYSSVPRSLYEVYLNDFFNQYNQIPTNDSNINTGESFDPLSDSGVQAAYALPFQKPDDLSYFQVPQVGLPPTFPTNGVAFNGGIVSAFPTNGGVSQPFTGLQHSQYLAPSPVTAPSSASTSSTSLQYALTPPPHPLVHKKAQKVDSKSKSKGKRTAWNVTQSAKRGLFIGQTKRRRGPNKRPSGTSFSELLGNLPREVRGALEQEYGGCCENVNTKDVSTRQKHLFSNKHCKNLKKAFQDHVPNFVCPGFVAFNKKCRSKAGRYDSTDRHCQNCVGFEEIRSIQKEAHPVVVTRAEYKALQRLRMAGEDGEEEQINEQTIDLAVGVVCRLLGDVFKDGLPGINDAGESNVSQPGALTTTDSDIAAQPPTSVPVPMVDYPEPPPLFQPVGVDEWNCDEFFVPAAASVP